MGECEWTGSGRTGSGRDGARCRQSTSGSRIQVSLLPPPWELLTTSEPSVQGDPGQAALGHVLVLAGQDEGPQVDVAGRQLAVAQRRRGRQREDRLGDVVVAASASTRARQSCSLRLGGGGADEHAVAARLVGRLDHELGRGRPSTCWRCFGVGAQQRRHVGDQRILVEVVADDRPARRRRRPCRRPRRRRGRWRWRRCPARHARMQARRAQHRVGAEHLGVEEEVVDAPVDARRRGPVPSIVRM